MKIKNWLILFPPTALMLALLSCNSSIQDSKIEKPFYDNYDSLSIKDTNNFVFFYSLKKKNIIRNYKTKELIDLIKECNSAKKNNIHYCIITSDSTMERKTYDTFGHLVLYAYFGKKVNIPKSTTKYFYDKENIIKEITYNSMGKATDIVSYSYDSKNNILSKNVMSLIPELNVYRIQTKELYKYSENGIVTQSKYLWSTKLNYVSKFLLDNKNNIIEENAIMDFKSKIYYYEIFNKNSADLISSGIKFNSSFNDTTFIINRFNINNQLSLRFEFQKGFNNYRAETYEYDNYGNLIKNISYRTNLKNISYRPNLDLSLHIYTYDSKNLLIKEISDFEWQDSINHIADTLYYKYIYY